MITTKMTYYTSDGKEFTCLTDAQIHEKEFTRTIEVNYYFTGCAIRTIEIPANADDELIEKLIEKEKYDINIEEIDFEFDDYSIEDKYV